MTLLLTVCSGAWANYGSENSNGTTTLTWDFGEYTTQVTLAGDNYSISYEGLTLVGNTNSSYTSDYVSASAGFHMNGNSSSNSRHIKYTPAYSGTLTVTYKSNNGSATDRITAIGTAVSTFSSTTENVPSTVLACGYTNGSTAQTISAELTAGTTYYIFFASGGQTITKLTYVYSTGTKTTWDEPSIAYVYDSSTEKYNITITSDDSAPTLTYKIGAEGDETTYSSTFAVDPGVTVYAKASGTGYDASDWATQVIPDKPSVEVPTYAIGPFNYDENGYEVTISCATSGATLQYIITGENPNDGSQSDYFDGNHGTVNTYTGPFYIYNKRVMIKASKDGYNTSYSAKGTRYLASDAPTGESPEVVGWNASGNGNAEMNAAHGNRAVNLYSGHFAGIPSTSLGTNGFKMRIGPNSIVPIISGVTKCLQMTVNSGYKVTKVKFDKIRANDAANTNKLSKVYVDGEELTDAFEAFDLPLSGADATSDFEIDLSGAANGGATSSIVIAFEDPSTGTAGTQYNAIITTTYEAVEPMTISSATWASFSNASEVAIPDGVTAYYASASDGSTSVTLKEITGGYIPANTGVVINGAANTYYATKTSTSASLGETNYLYPWLTAGTPNPGGDYYTLAVSGTTPVFKKSTGGILAAGKSYLYVPGEETARELKVTFDDDNTTGISDAKRITDNSQVVYDLQGRRVAQPSKGLYIVNGKKVMVK